MADLLLKLVLVATTLAALCSAQSLGVGRTPTEEEVRAWDITIYPDGRELPDGKGAPAEGQEVYRVRCEECHGPEAKGADQAALVGGHETLATDKPKKTATGYWPYATTVFDYIRRSMPFDRPGTLTDDQVYAVTAYLLSLDNIIGTDEEMNRETLPKVAMPNKDGFIPDPR